MNWLWKLVWRMKSDSQLFIAKDDAMFWLKTYKSDASTVKNSAKYRWDTFIKPEMQRRGLIGEIEL